VAILDLGAGRGLLGEKGGGADGAGAEDFTAIQGSVWLIGHHPPIHV
jgi:hypothetical protein